MLVTMSVDDGDAGQHAVRIAIADDDVLLREGLASLLASGGFDVVGQAGDAVALLTLVREREPELVIVDIRMPPTHSTEGLDAARSIRRASGDRDPGLVGACGGRGGDGAPRRR